MNEIAVSELRRLRINAQGAQLVDVRSPSEYAAGHVPGAVNIPMNEIEMRQADLSGDQLVILICKSGMRACITAKMLEGSRENVSVLRGGTEAWVKAGLPVVVNAKTRWSLERQVRLTAGILVLVGVLMSVTLYSPMIYLAGFVGLGQTFAGLTDFCAMGILLGKMPWNGVRKVKVAGAAVEARS